jgi:HlyD family secretion protein
MSRRPGRRPFLANARIVLWLYAAMVLGGCQRGGGGEGIIASGYVEASTVQIRTKVPGTVLNLAFVEGQRVEKGAVLAQLDTVDLSLALTAARAERDQARADLRLRLAGSRVEEVREAAALEARAAAEFEAADRDLARMQALLDRGSGTTKARDDARAQRDQAAAARDAAHEQFLRRKNGSRPEEIEAARARAAAGDARVAQLGQQLKDARITSPLEGVVTERLTEPGELLAGGASVCAVVDLRHSWLTVYVSEGDLSRIRVGQPATVTTGGGEQRSGTLTFVSDRAEFTPRNVQTREERARLVYKLKITLPNEDSLFKPGMPAEAILPASAERS